jgi:hypothetical protein
MSNPALAEIERRIDQLSRDEQLWLIERLAHRLRQKTSARTIVESDLAGLAADPDVQRELREIEQDFRGAEGDGL